MTSSRDRRILEEGIARAEASAVWRAGADARQVARYLARYRGTERPLCPEVRLVAENADLMVRHGIRPPPLTVGPVLFRSALLALLSLLPLLLLGLSVLGTLTAAVCLFMASESRRPQQARIAGLLADLERARTMESPEYREAMALLDRGGLERDALARFDRELGLSPS